MRGMSMVAPSSTLSTNSSLLTAPSDLQSRTVSAISRHSSLVGVLIIMSVFLVLTVSTTGWMLAFCKKKNTVFALQKCEQDSQYELDDMDQTDTELCDDSEISPKMKRVRSQTCPSFSNVTDSDWSVESPSREPLVRHSSRNQSSNSAAVNMLPRSYSINVLQNGSCESLELENIDHFSTKADVNLLLALTSSVESEQTSIEMTSSEQTSIEALVQ